MFTYTAREIVGEIYSHYTVDKKSGMIVEVFGWDNSGDHENLRHMVYDAISIILDSARERAANNRKRVFIKRFTKYLSTTNYRYFGAEAKTSADSDRYVAVLEALLTRINDALDLPRVDRSRIARYSGMTDALMEECRRHITISLLDMDKEYTLETPLTKWSPATHVVYFVESDFTISEWRVGISGYENIISGCNVDGLELSYHVHNFDTDRTNHQTTYDEETGNFIRRWNTYRDGEYNPGGDDYCSNLDDAIAIAKKSMKELRKKQKSTFEMATEKLNALAA